MPYDIAAPHISTVYADLYMLAHRCFNLKKKGKKQKLSVDEQKNFTEYLHSRIFIPEIVSVCVYECVYVCVIVLISWLQLKAM